jgi:hypothetical protein
MWSKRKTLTKSFFGPNYQGTKSQVIICWDTALLLCGILAQSQQLRDCLPERKSQTGCPSVRIDKDMTYLRGVGRFANDEGSMSTDAWMIARDPDLQKGMVTTAPGLVQSRWKT